MSSLDDYWLELVSGALLGTDRRDPPHAPPGPVADVVADALRPDPASRMLAAVGAVAAARRAAFVPGPPVPSLQPPPIDERPWCPVPAIETWRTIVSEWAVLEDEWVLTVIERGFRLPPDALAALLVRHRNDAVRSARVALAAGPAAPWLADHVPQLAAGGERSARAEAVANLPELPVPPELAELLAADAYTFSQRLAAGFEMDEFGPAHRAVLVNLFARCRPAVLVDAAEMLADIGVGQALALADLARLRHKMLAELGATT